MGYWGDAAAEALVTPEETANAVLGYQRLAGGQGNLGAVVPPRLAAGTGVPVVSGLRVATTASLVGSTSVVLTWLEPHGWRDRVATYNVYVKAAVGDNRAPQLVGSSFSPAKFAVASDSVVGMTFVVQTVLRTGQASPVETSPSCTANSTTTTLTPASFPTEQIVVVGMTLTNNSPSAGDLAWSACTVYYNGTAYAVAGGNTSDRFVYWTVGAGTFSHAASFAPDKTTFAVATNVAGTGDTAWNKLGAKGVQRSNLAFSLLNGFELQPLGTATLNANGTSGLAAVTTGTAPYGGALICGGLVLTGAGAMDVALEVTIDGSTTQSYSLRLGTAWEDTAKAVSQTLLGTGASVGDTLTIPFGVGFETDLTVDVVVSNYTAGTAKASVLWANKLTP